MATHVNLTQAAKELGMSLSLLKVFVHQGVLAVHSENDKILVSEEELQDFRERRQLARAHVENALNNKDKNVSQLTLTPEDMSELDKL